MLRYTKRVYYDLCDQNHRTVECGQARDSSTSVAALRFDTSTSVATLRFDTSTSVAALRFDTSTCKCGGFKA